MSHISTVRILITDLDAMERAAADRGMRLNRQATTFRAYYGEKDGMQAAIEVLNPENHRCYSVGLRAMTFEEVSDVHGLEVANAMREAGKTVYEAKYDAWQGGYGLLEHTGTNLGALLQRYGYHATMNEARALGMTVETEQLADGTIRMWMEPQQSAVELEGNWNSGGW